MPVFSQIGGNLVLAVVLPILGDGNSGSAVLGDDGGRSVLTADDADLTGTAGQRAERQQQRQP